MTDDIADLTDEELLLGVIAAASRIRRDDMRWVKGLSQSNRATIRQAARAAIAKAGELLARDAGGDDDVSDQLAALVEQVDTLTSALHKNDRVDAVTLAAQIAETIRDAADLGGLPVMPAAPPAPKRPIFPPPISTPPITAPAPAGGPWVRRPAGPEPPTPGPIFPSPKFGGPWVGGGRAPKVTWSESGPIWGEETDHAPITTSWSSNSEDGAAGALACADAMVGAERDAAPAG